RDGKFESLTAVGYLVGYNDTNKAWRFYVPAAHRVVPATSVTFFENMMFHEETASSLNSTLDIFTARGGEIRANNTAVGTVTGPQSVINKDVRSPEAVKHVQPTSTNGASSTTEASRTEEIAPTTTDMTASSNGPSILNELDVSAKFINSDVNHQQTDEIDYKTETNLSDNRNNTSNTTEDVEYYKVDTGNIIGGHNYEESINRRKLRTKEY
ncbi:hypothetical protein MP638_001837, partial [Amoeboaphelidium occidentale]